MASLTVPGTLDALESVTKYVMAAAAAAGLDKKAAYRLRLAVDEIATNIITHGYLEAGYSGELDLEAVIDEKTLTISVEDTGVPYSPRQTPPPDNLDKPPEKRELGGLGVFLAMQSVDKFTYERVGNRNRNVFVVNRPATSPE